MIKDFFKHKEENLTVVGWLPFFHDMGLIGNILQPLYLGGRCILTSYIDVLQNPYLWLKLISDYKANTSGSPNFMYDLCCDKISEEEKKSLDLSHWTLAYNGAEPINPSTLKRFAKTFEKCGFKETSFFPCYGMAEATLIISGHEQGTPPIYKKINKEKLKSNKIEEALTNNTDSKEVVGSGYNHPNQSIKIVNPNSKIECSTNEVGEIWVNGSHITQGYWNKTEVNLETFNAKLKDDESKVTYLRTGDLGFFDNNSALFITGRLKDLMIINGKNIYPQDIETIVELSHEAIRQNFCACFSINKSKEQIIAVAELKRQYLRTNDFTDIIKAMNLSQHDQAVHEVILIKTNTISKTSSGKLQRFIIKEQYLKNQLHIMANSKTIFDLNSNLEKELRAPKNKIEEEIVNILKKQLNSQNISPEDELLSLGIDSIGLAEISFQIEKIFFVSFTMEEIFSIESIEVLCEKIEEKQLNKINDLDIKDLQEFLLIST